MVQARLVRVETDKENGTFGVLLLNGELFCNTLEPYSRDNAQNISCIPSGQYICKRYSSGRYPETFQVTGVQGRTLILFHAGNIDEHTEGCILLGERVGKLRGDRAILNSGKTFGNFIKKLVLTPEFKLTVVEAY